MNQFDQLLDNESDLLDILKVVKAKKESKVTKVANMVKQPPRKET